MPDSSVVIAVDIGTTSTKAIALDARGLECARAERRHSLQQRSPGESIQDPRAVLDATIAAIRSAVPVDRRVAGLAFSAALHSLIGLDTAGEPLTPLLTWADVRAEEQAKRLRAEHPELHAQTGTPLHPMAPLAKLIWLRESQPDLFRRVSRWVGIKELVLAELTGELVVDSSCASATGLRSLTRGVWDEQALALAGITPDQLSPIVPVRHALALSDDRLGVPIGTPTIVGAGDGPLANLGVGAVRPGVAACSIGTSGALRLIVERPAVDPEGQLFCYGLTEELWAAGGAISNGGSVLQWARAALAPGEREDRLLELAGTIPPGSDGLVMLPYLLGERAPRWSADARGAYVGLSQLHRRGHLVRAAIEGVCLQIALVLESIEAAGLPVSEIRATGGFATSVLWRQILADVLGMPIGFSAGTDGSARGAALLGLEALGLIDSMIGAAEALPVEETRSPQAAAAAAYAELRPFFKDLYEALAPAFQALGGLRRC